MTCAPNSVELSHPKVECFITSSLITAEADAKAFVVLISITDTVYCIHNEVIEFSQTAKRTRDC
jgi:hypothetical protein